MDRDRPGRLSDTARPVLAAATSVAAGFLVVFVAWPLTAVLWRSLADVGPERLGTIVGRRATWSVVWFTLWQAALSAALTLIVGLPIAHALATMRFRGRSVVRAAVVVPFVLPTVVVAAAVGGATASLGLGDRPLLAVLAAHVVFNVAVVVRVVGGRWAQLDERPVEAARLLGAGPIEAVLRVTLPRLLPVIASAGLLVFLFSFTSFGVVLILGGASIATIETEIHRFAVFRQEFDVAAVLALIQLVVVIVASALSTLLQRRIAATRHGRVRAGGRPVDGAVQRIHLGVVLAGVLVIVGLPLVALVEGSLRVGGGWGLDHYAALTEPVSVLPVTFVRALGTSLVVAVVAMVVASAVGAAAAFAVTRTGRSGRIVEVVALVPLGVSAVTLGFGYLLAFTVLDLRRSVWIVPIAHAVVGLPFVLAAAVPALRAVGERRREAAAMLGAAPSTVLRRVDWPMARRAVATGAGFAFAVSVGEFGATTFLARSDSTFTAPLAIVRLLSQPGALLRGQAMAASVVVAIVVATVGAWLERRRGPVGLW